MPVQAVVPVGKLQERVLLEFASLITAFRQAPLELLSLTHFVAGHCLLIKPLAS